MSIFYCNFLSISPLFLYDTTINSILSWSLQFQTNNETLFPHVITQIFWNYFSLNPSPNIIYPWCRAWHSTKSGWAPLPPTSLTLESSRLDLHVVQSSIVLRLVEHAMEAEHSGQIDEFLLGRGSQDVVPLRLQMLLFLLWLWFNFGFPDLAYKIKVKQFIISLHCVLTGSSSALTFGSTLGFPETVPWKKFAKRHQNLIPWFSGSTAYF